MQQLKLPAEDSRRTEEDLVSAIRQSDHAAFKELCRIYYQRLYHFLWRKTRDENVAMDLVQELFTAVWKRREHLDEKRSIKAYLFNAANNLAINHLKKKVRRQTVLVEGAIVDSMTSVEQNEDFQQFIDEALHSLPEAERTVFILNKFEGFKYFEIAETLNISVKTVESRMSRVLKVLREKYKHLL